MPLNGSTTEIEFLDEMIRQVEDMNADMQLVIADNAKILNAKQARTRFVSVDAQNGPA